MPCAREIWSWDFTVPLRVTLPPLVDTETSASFMPGSDAIAALILPVVMVSPMAPVLLSPAGPGAGVALAVVAVLDVSVAVVLPGTGFGFDGVVAVGEAVLPELLYAVLPVFGRSQAAASAATTARTMRV